MNEKILIVEDEFVEADFVQALITRAGYRCTGIERSVASAITNLESEKPDLVLLDIFLKGSQTGIQLGRILREKEIAFLYLSANSNTDTLNMARPTEPYGFLVKPFRDKDLLIAIDIALYLHEQKKQFYRRRASPRKESRLLKPSGLHGMLGQSIPLLAVLEDMETVAPTDVSVLILGETGTGKELVATAVHRLSPRKDGPFVTVNCAALAPTLVESILFGHEAGAFTGATQKQKGKFEQASGGTIFLDEIGELNHDMQMKLLRVLQQKSIDILGAEKSLSIDCRVIAATNRNLEAEVAEGRFRMDLFYRLNVFPLTLPPLRDRKEDILILARHFVDLYSTRMQKPVPTITPGQIAAFQKYNWPGNIRELEHLIQRAVLLTKGDKLADIPLGKAAISKTPAPTTGESLDDVEKGHIIATLRNCHGKISGSGGAAELLGLNVSTLNSRIKKLGIKKIKNIF